MKGGIGHPLPLAVAKTLAAISSILYLNPYRQLIPHIAIAIHTYTACPSISMGSVRQLLEVSQPLLPFPSLSPSAPNRPACANGYSTFLIRNADVWGDEMDEFVYIIDI